MATDIVKSGSSIESNLHQWAKASADLVVKNRYRENDIVLQDRVRKDLIQSFVSGARHVLLALENNVR